MTTTHDTTSRTQSVSALNCLRNRRQSPRVLLAMLLAVVSGACNQSTSPTGPSATPNVSVSSIPSGDAAVAGLSAAVNTHATQLPFKGSMDGGFTFELEPSPSTFAAVAFTSVGGHATQLGAFAIEAPHRVNLATMPAEAAGTFRFTAANGDMLTATFTGLGTPTATPGVLSVVETATITGGTGRFAGATGNFVVERSVDLNTLFTTGSFSGVITY